MSGCSFADTSHPTWQCAAGSNAYILSCTNCTSSSTPFAGTSWWKTSAGKGALAGIIGALAEKANDAACFGSMGRSPDHMAARRLLRPFLSFCVGA